MPSFLDHSPWEFTMFRLARPFLGLSLVLLALSPGFGRDKPADNAFYPLAVGTTWTYSDVPSGASGSRGSKFVMKVVPYEGTEKDVKYSKIALLNDAMKEIAYELIHETKDGVFRLAFDGVKPNEPIQIIKFPLKDQATWPLDAKALNDTLKGTFKVGKEKEIEVPAGKYKVYPITIDDLDASGLKASSTSYYAAGVGLVKQEIKIGTQTTTIELEKFEAGKK
jgi:hypothetical protein